MRSGQTLESPTHTGFANGTGSATPNGPAASSFGLGYGSTATEAQLSPTDVQDVLAKLFIAGCAGKPVVICLDNVHFLDAHSWRVLLK